MSVITPNSDVILLKVPLEMSEEHQLTFANATAQYNYFNGLPTTSKKAFDKFTYQRKDNAIKLPELIDNLYGFNYVMYRNTNYSSKWFYAYITGFEYVNDSVTLVKIKTDVWQTWQFDLTYRSCFVEREHVNNDGVGLHTVPEDVELGEYVKNSVTGTPTIGKFENFLYAVGLSELIGTITDANDNEIEPAARINGMPQGLYYMFTDSTSNLQGIVDMYDDAGKSDAIYTMFIFPKDLLYSGGTYAYKGAKWNYSGSSGTIISILTGLYAPTATSDPATLVTARTITLPTKVGKTYTPKNNKLFTWPYCFFNISNNNGTSVTYHYEDFSGTPSFNLEGVFSIGCSMKLFPTNYKNMDIFTGTVQDNPYDYGLNAGKYPTISWRSDAFTNWITQNAVNMNSGTLLSGAAGFVGGMKFGGIVGGVAGAALSTAMSVSRNIAKTEQASVIPDQVKGNINAGDINYGKHKNSFTVFEMSIKPEYAEIIDNYFSMFGYKVNALKTPNVTGRTNWNYVKTIGCYIEATIPQDDLAEIKAMFDRGITFWHNPATFGMYNQTNSIVS